MCNGDGFGSYHRPLWSNGPDISNSGSTIFFCPRQNVPPCMGKLPRLLETHLAGKQICVFDCDSQPRWPQWSFAQKTPQPNGQLTIKRVGCRAVAVLDQRNKVYNRPSLKSTTPWLANYAGWAQRCAYDKANRLGCRI